MGRVLTNNTGFQYGIEPSLGGTPIEWQELEPNTINQFGATITTVPRNPISKKRQRRKGTTTDLDSAVEFEADLTLDAFLDFIEGFCFSVAVNADMTIESTAVETTGDTYTVAALTAAQAAKLEFSAAEYATLIYGRGFTNSGNNGVQELDADIATSATAISVAGNLVDEAVAPNGARVELAGLRSLAAAADLTWDYDAGTETATLTSTGPDIADFTVFGLSVGQLVHIGSPNTAGTAVINAFENLAVDDMFGYARVQAFITNGIVFDKLDAALKFDDLTAPATAVDILFGQFIRNVAVDDASFIERSYQFEAAWENLGNPSGDEYEYAKGNFANQAQFNLNLADKATVTFGFIGVDTCTPASVRTAGAGGAVAATGLMTLSANVANLDTITINGQTYTFETVLTDTADFVFIGASASDSIDNLIAAITAGAGAGTLYGTGTVANTGATATVGAGDTMDLTSLLTGDQGNAVDTTVSSATASFAAVTLTGGQDAPKPALGTSAFNTSADIARLRINNVDDTGLTTDFKTLTLTLNNNVSPEKVLGQLGAKFLNTGNFEVDVESQLLFTNSAVVAAIKANLTVTMDFILRNADGAIAVDIPSFTLGGGDREMPVNESVLINTTGEAFEDTVLGTSIGVSIFPIAPATSSSSFC